MNELQVFNSSEFGNIRTIIIDNEPYFVGIDIANVLGYSNASKAVSVHVDKDDRRKEMIAHSQNGNTVTETTVINESGLYSLILSSKLPSAKKFKRWVTSEVLPSIRKTGSYHLPQTYSEALRELADIAEQKERLLLENQQMKPKADFFDAVADSKTAISMNEVSKVLGIKGYGRNNLFEFLRDKGVLDKYNVPYQRFVDRGYFRVIEQSYMQNGERQITTKTLVYQKGVDAIRKLLLKEIGE